MSVTGTAVVPLDGGAPTPPDAHLAWRNGRMGVLAEGLATLPRHAVVDGERLAVSHTGRAWTAWALDEFQSLHPIAERYTLWDLPRLAASASAGERGSGEASFELDLDSDRESESRLMLVIVGSHVESATLETALDAASPFTFRREDVRAIPMEASPVLAPAEVDGQDRLALDGHLTLIGWIRGFRELAGVYPETVTPETLLLQRLGAEWPESPYDGEPMRHGGPMGHFTWEYCSPQDATFVGHGWDGATIEESFGAGCKASPAEG